MPRGARYGHGCVALTVVVGACLGLAGCATQVVVRPTPPPTMPATIETPSDVPTVVPTAFADSVEPAPLLTAAQAAGLSSSPWTLQAVSADGRTITVRANQGSGCDHRGGMEVVQRADRVELTSLLSLGTPPPGGGCLSFLDAPLWTVPLSAPLGHRVLVHAPATGSVP